MRCAKGRASTSLGPPAANGLIMVMGRTGHSSALAAVVKVNATRATSALAIFPMAFLRIVYALCFRRLDRFGRLKGASLRIATISLNHTQTCVLRLIASV